MGKVPSHTKNQSGGGNAAAPATTTTTSPTSPSHQPQHRNAFQHQISETSFLDGVTFTLNSKFAPNRSSSQFDFPQPKFKSAEDIENEFSYVFTSEYELI